MTDAKARARQIEKAATLLNTTVGMLDGEPMPRASIDIQVCTEAIAESVVSVFAASFLGAEVRRTVSQAGTVMYFCDFEAVRFTAVVCS